MLINQARQDKRSPLKAFTTVTILSWTPLFLNKSRHPSSQWVSTTILLVNVLSAELTWMAH